MEGRKLPTVLSRITQFSKLLDDLDLPTPGSLQIAYKVDDDPALARLWNNHGYAKQVSEKPSALPALSIQTSLYSLATPLLRRQVLPHLQPTTSTHQQPHKRLPKEVGGEISCPKAQLLRHLDFDLNLERNLGTLKGKYNHHRRSVPSSFDVNFWVPTAHHDPMGFPPA